MWILYVDLRTYKSTFAKEMGIIALEGKQETWNLEARQFSSLNTDLRAQKRVRGLAIKFSVF